ncbi:sulfotransferase [Silanimonas sp.]|uniref:tetratricopeptide repeat-containing sulfotransferase family protein n=1 Tax=Silanimonas sp. TaxID=1929290 RepID=UPI0037CA11DF
MNPNPPHAGAPRPRLAEGFAALRENRLDIATALRDQWLATHRDDAEVRFYAAEVGAFTGELEDALAHIEAAIVLAPAQWPLVLKKARLLLALRRRDAFRAAADEAVRLAGNDPQALWEIGRAHTGNDDPRSARPLFERALSTGFDHPGLRMNLAATQFFAGEFDAAETTLARVLHQAPRVGEAVHLRSTLRRQTAAANHLADLEARVAEPATDPSYWASVLYALAKEREDLGDAPAAFAAMSEGAALWRRNLRYDPAAELASIDALREAFDASALARLGAGHDKPGPIFIVGLPRTGTTLLERMLDRVPGVRSAGELMDFKQALGAAVAAVQRERPGLSPIEASLAIDAAALGRDYLRGAREAAGGSPVFIDKMPVNFLYCGLIHAALPKARILHLRREPLDACHAVFKTLFAQAYFFSYDQGELAAYYDRYRRLMAHWQAVAPGAILDVRYEDLVIDTEAQARRVLDFCGLPWDDAVLRPEDNARPSTTASAAQVRQPVHAASVGRWRSVAEGLAPLRARLFEAGWIDAEGNGR